MAVRTWDRSERAAFIEAIRRADLNDVAPALIYADWLEERGDSDRAEYIRLVTEEALLDDNDPDQHIQKLDLSRQVSALWRKHGQTWNQELPDLGYAYWGDWDRGFIRSIRVDNPEAWLENGQEVLDLAPISRFESRGRQRWRKKELHQEVMIWTRAPGLERFYDLSLENYSPEIIEVLAKRDLSRLRVLRLSNCQLEDRHLITWIRAGSFDRLDRIELDRNLIGYRGALKLLKRFDTLQYCTIRDNPLSNKDIRTLLNCESFPKQGLQFTLEAPDTGWSNSVFNQWIQRTLGDFRQSCLNSKFTINAQEPNHAVITARPWEN